MHLRRQGAVLVLACLLAAPWVASAEPRLEERARAEPRVAGVSELLSYALSLFQSLWGAASACDEGPRMDSLGCPQPTTDAGPRADPLG